MKKTIKSAVSLCLTAILIFGVIAPMSVLAAPLERHILKISDVKTNILYSNTDHINPEDITSLRAMDGHVTASIFAENALFKIQFSMQYTQNYNLSLYRLKNTFELKAFDPDDRDGCKDTTMITDYLSHITQNPPSYDLRPDASYDPRGEFLGYL
jgi:hypothetical protein